MEDVASELGLFPPEYVEQLRLTLEMDLRYQRSLEREIESLTEFVSHLVECDNPYRCDNDRHLITTESIREYRKSRR